MEIQETIENLKYLISDDCTDNQTDFIEEIEIAIDALEKQIPKKPIETNEQHIRYSMNYICPSCGKHFSGTGIASYCYHCGQALDWDNHPTEKGGVLDAD